MYSEVNLQNVSAPTGARGRSFREWLIQTARRRLGWLPNEQIPLPPDEVHHRWCMCDDCVHYYRFHCRRCQRSLTFKQSAFDFCPSCRVDTLTGKGS